jgi:hypothetical protein
MQKSEALEAGIAWQLGEKPHLGRISIGVDLHWGWRIRWRGPQGPSLAGESQGKVGGDTVRYRCCLPQGRRSGRGPRPGMCRKL